MIEKKLPSIIVTIIISLILNIAHGLNTSNHSENKDFGTPKVKIIDVSIESKHPGISWSSEEDIVANKYGSTELKAHTRHSVYHTQWNGVNDYSGHFQLIYRKNNDIVLNFQKEGFLDQSITISSQEIINLIKEEYRITSVTHDGKSVNALKLYYTINLMPSPANWIKFKAAFLKSCKESFDKKSIYPPAVKFSELYDAYFSENEKSSFLQTVKEYEYTEYDLASLKSSVKLKTNRNFTKIDSLACVKIIARKEKSIKRSELLEWNANRNDYPKVHVYKSFNTLKKEGVNRPDFFGTEGYAIEYREPVSYLLPNGYKFISFLYSPTKDDLTINNIKFSKSNIQIANLTKDVFKRGDKDAMRLINGFIVSDKHYYKKYKFIFDVDKNKYEKYLPETISLENNLEEGKWYFVTILQTEMTRSNPPRLYIYINGNKYISIRSRIRTKYPDYPNVTIEGGIIDELSISNNFKIGDYKYYLNDKDAIEDLEASYEYHSPENVKKREIEAERTKNEQLSKFDQLPTEQYISEQSFFDIVNDEYLGKISFRYTFGYSANKGNLEFSDNPGQNQYSFFDVVDITGDRIEIKYTRGLGAGKVETFQLDRKNRRLIRGDSTFSLSKDRNFWYKISKL